MRILLIYSIDSYLYIIYVLKIDISFKNFLLFYILKFFANDFLHFKIHNLKVRINMNYFF